MSSSLQQALLDALKKKEGGTKKPEENKDYWEDAVNFINTGIAGAQAMIMVSNACWYSHLMGSCKHYQKYVFVEHYHAGGYVFMTREAAENLIAYKCGQGISTKIIEELPTRLPNTVELRVLEIQRV